MPNPEKAMTFQTISEGWVSRRQPDTPTAVAAGPRCAVTKQGEIVCTFMVQSSLGINDFQPMIARSADAGKTWSEGQPLWPHLTERYSIFGSVSRAPDGDLLYFGTRYPIDTPGESFWSEATQGLKDNELIWSRSADDGRTWCEPQVIPMPIPGAAEAPGVADWASLGPHDLLLRTVQHVRPPGRRRPQPDRRAAQ